MGKIITQEMHLLLTAFGKEQFLTSHFYFTGGTALSLYYLNHRESVDLDFFSQKKFTSETIFKYVTSWQRQLHFTYEDVSKDEDMQIYKCTFSNRIDVKTDFVYYPYRKLEAENVFEGIRVDSLFDIAVNKLLTIQQRTAVKDFVDLYFLLQKFSVWDLMEGLRIKFHMKTEPFVIASDFLKAEKFDILPRMLVPLTLEELQAYFKNEAKKLSSKSVE